MLAGLSEIEILRLKQEERQYQRSVANVTTQGVTTARGEIRAASEGVAMAGHFVLSFLGAFLCGVDEFLPSIPPPPVIADSQTTFGELVKDINRQTAEKKQPVAYTDNYVGYVDVPRRYNGVRKEVLHNQISRFLSHFRHDVPFVLLSETRASCFDVLSALEWIVTNLIRYHTETMRAELTTDVQAVSHNSQQAFEDNTLINEYNEVAGMELFYFYGASMISLMEAYLELLLSVILLQPHCFNAETRLQLCKILTDEVRKTKQKWAKVEFLIAWKNLYATADAFRLKTHVEAVLESGIYAPVDALFEVQSNVLRNVLDKRRAALQNRVGENTAAKEIGHDWKPVEESGGFVDFLYLYRSRFDHWTVDRSLIRGIIKMFAHEFDSVADLGAGGGKYAELLQLGFARVKAVDASPIATEVTGGLVGFADLSKPLTGSFGEGEESESTEQESDIAMCIEVAEHVAPEFEAVLMENLARAAKHFLVLSWSNDRENDYHVNPLPREDVVRKMEDCCGGVFSLDGEKTEKLQRAASVSWIRDNVMVFRKRKKPRPEDHHEGEL
eukprot:g6369.t1